MALLYPWATKEYLLWNMTIGQIVMYYNKGIDMKSGKPEEKPGLMGMTAEQLREFRDRVMSPDEIAESEANKDQYRAKYGDI